jgi:hypothetical protein
VSLNSISIFSKFGKNSVFCTISKESIKRADFLKMIDDNLGRGMTSQREVENSPVDEAAEAPLGQLDQDPGPAANNASSEALSAIHLKDNGVPKESAASFDE